MRQKQHAAGSAHRLDRGIEPEPMVLMLMNPGRAATERAPHPAVRGLQAEPGMGPLRPIPIHGEDSLYREPGHGGPQLIFKCRLIGGTGGLSVMWTSGLQLGPAPPEQLGNGIDAVPD